MAYCKMSVRKTEENSTSTICAIANINMVVYCMGTDIDKESCPFWNNTLGEKQ